VPAPPWLGEPFLGSHLLLEKGARPLTSTEVLLASLGLAPTPPPPAGPSAAELPTVTRPLSESESVVLASTSGVPLHLDEIAARAQSPAAAVAVALLTLALENVVVEGPPGFFRRRDALK
jgi:DNA processing protein